MIAVDDYVGFLEREYLRGYVDQGGAAVKFAIAPDAESAEAFMARLASAGRDAGYSVAAVDAVEVRVHLLEQVFFDVARQIDWDELALRATRVAVAAAGYPALADGQVSLDALAAHHRVEVRELRRDVDRELQQRVHRDYAMIPEFRTAMLRLCQAQLRAGHVSDAEHAAILDWLRGELRTISALRSALIFRRVGRHNARPMLFSLAHWLAINDHAGLLLVLDLRRLGFARRPRPEERQGHYYTKTALLDAYEVLRQLVDNTDELANCFLAVVASSTLVTDPVRGLDAYQALKLRVFDEVRDRRRDNPYSSLVRLGAA